MTAPGTPGASTAQPNLGPPPDPTGERQKALIGPTQPGMPTSPSSPTLPSDQSTQSTDSMARGAKGATSVDPVVPPTATECARGWSPESRWRQDELAKYCNR